MSHIYQQRKRPAGTVPGTEAAPAQPSLDALRSGAAKPTAGQMGRRVDLPEAMRAKMEESFGADLSAVKLYESEAVGAAGAEAVTQGSNIAFAPGMLDFSSFGGQALLGHELSHVVSQQRGEVTGGGFMNDHALEARADREGAMAAAGQQIAAPVAAMSGFSAAPAAGPMQAKKAEEKMDISGPLEVKTSNASLDYLDLIQQNAYKQNNSFDSANKDYLRNMKTLLSGMSPEQIRADTALQERVLSDTSSLSNASMLARQKANSDRDQTTSFGEYSTAGLRSGVGDSAMGAFTAMLNGLMGGAGAINDTMVPGGVASLPEEAPRGKPADISTETADASLASYQNALAGNDRAMEMLGKFGDRAFNGIQMSADKQSTALMNSLYNHATSTFMQEKNPYRQREVKRHGSAAMRSAKIDSDTGDYTADTTETGKGFLQFFKNRFKK